MSCECETCKLRDRVEELESVCCGCGKCKSTEEKLHTHICELGQTVNTLMCEKQKLEESLRAHQDRTQQLRAHVRKLEERLKEKEVNHTKAMARERVEELYETIADERDELKARVRELEGHLENDYKTRVNKKLAVRVQELEKENKRLNWVDGCHKKQRETIKELQTDRDVATQLHLADEQSVRNVVKEITKLKTRICELKVQELFNERCNIRN